MYIKLVSCTLLISFALWCNVEGVEIPAKIPNNLEECYNDTSMIKENLLPMTMRSFISLVGKIEKALGSMNARTLSTVLLRRFRFDGIEWNPEVISREGVIPYSPSRNEFPLYRMLMEYMISSVGQDTFPNDTLLRTERCSLHQMLSLSVNKWERPDGDSVCSNLQKMSRTLNRRRPRSADSADSEIEIIKPNTDAAVQTEAEPESENFMHVGNSQMDYPESACPMENGVVYDDAGAVCPGIVLAGIAAGLQPQKVQPKQILDLKPKGPRGFVKKGQPGAYGKRPGFRTGVDPAPGPVPPGPYQPKPPGPRYNPGSNVVIDNKWAATVSGLLAEIMLLQGPKDDYKIGADGGWNDTNTPKYYFLKERNDDAFTDARIRSTMDGLIIASNVLNWNNQYGSGDLTLSSILNMYYSSDGAFGLRACDRKKNFQTVAQIDELREQTYAFSTVLQDDLPRSVNVEDSGLEEFSNEASTRFMQYTQSMNDPSCQNPSPGTSNYTSNPVADLHVVVDCNWDKFQLSSILSLIAADILHTGMVNNMTLISSKTGLPLYDTFTDVGTYVSSTTFGLCNMTVQRGFEMRAVLNQLKDTMNGRLNWDRDNSREGVTVPRIVLFIPSMSANVADSDRYAIFDRINGFKITNPDVKFLYFVPGSKDKFSPFADNADKDVITTNSIDASADVSRLIQRISEIPRRVFNPSCGSSWSNRGYGSASYSGYLNPWEIQYFRVQPNYFYGDCSATLKVQPNDATAPIYVCNSRNDPNPGNVTSGSSKGNCQQLTSGKQAVFSLTNSLCPDNYASLCNPFYMSVATSSSGQCLDPQCTLPTQVKFTLSHDGLICYSGATSLQLAVYLLLAVLGLHLARQ